MMQGVKFTLFCVYVLALTLSGSALLQDSLTPDEIRNIEKFAGDIMGCVNIPGLALTVVRGEYTFSTGLGVANMATGHPVDSKTIFNLGSAAKAFVPYLLAEIMNGKENRDGRTSWGSSLKDILRNDRGTEVPSFWADTTLKDMLVYKSGSSAADLAIMAGLPARVTRSEVIRRLRLLPTSPEFKNSNHYSNVMYTVAGHLAEDIAGMPWKELVKAKVFDKLTMTASSFAPEGMAVEGSALPYRFHASKPGEQFHEQNASLFNIHPFEPAGSLMSSAEDMSKWLRHLIKNLNAKGNDSGINMLIEDAFHLWVTVPGDHKEGSLVHDSEVALGYGMGWYASTYRGQRRFKYSGGLYAYHTQIWLYPDSYSAIFVSINGPGIESARRAVDGIMYHISDIILRKPAWVSTDMICLSPDNHHEHFNESNTEYVWSRKEQNSKKYEGTFGNGLVGNVNIKLNNSGSLILKIGRNFIGRLSPGFTESKLRFVSTGPLINTEESFTGKTFEFLSLENQGEVIKTRRFEKVRVYVKEQLFYEFHRAVSFETLLALAEENDRKQQDDARISQSRRPPVNANKEPDSNKFKSNSRLDSESLEKTDSEGQQIQKSDSMTGQGDSSDLDVGTAEKGSHQVGELNPSSSKSKNTSCSIRPFPLSVILITLLITL